MPWNLNTNPLVTSAFLMAAPGPVVLEVLRAYAEDPEQVSMYRWPPDGVEEALASRHDKVIDLALAMYATKPKLVRELYVRAMGGTDDAMQDKAMRLAVLSNRVMSGMYFSDNRNAAVLDEDITRLATSGPDDEYRELLRNPSRRPQLPQLFEGTGPFAGIDAERQRRGAIYASENPALTLDEPGYDSPDFGAMEITKGLLALVKNAPATADWLVTLHQLLCKLPPGNAWYVDQAAEARAIIDRWRAVRIMKKNEEEPGYYTGQTMVDEFICLLATLFNCKDMPEGAMGSAASEDLAMRCSWYAHETPTSKAMNAGHVRDGWTHSFEYTFAAMRNLNLMCNPELRAQLEEMLPGYQHQLYLALCRVGGAQWPTMRPAPLTAAITVDEASTKALATTQREQQVLSRLSTVETRLSKLPGYVIWVGVALGVLVIILRH